jgi:hypothetical protein
VAARSGGCQPIEQARESLVAGDVDAGEGHVVIQHDGGPSVRATRLHPRPVAVINRAPVGDDDVNTDLRPYREDLGPLIARGLSEAWSFASVTPPPPGAVTSRRVHRS